MTPRKATGALLSGCYKQVRQKTYYSWWNRRNALRWAEVYRDIEDPYHDFILSLPVGVRGGETASLDTKAELGVFLALDCVGGGGGMPRSHVVPLAKNPAIIKNPNPATKAEKDALSMAKILKIKVAKELEAKISAPQYLLQFDAKAYCKERAEIKVTREALRELRREAVKRGDVDLRMYQQELRTIAIFPDYKEALHLEA